MSGPPVKLSAATLGEIAARGVPTPAYDRAALVPRILHLGVGGFHRAHLAVYVDELAAQGSDWAIRGLGRLEGDRAMQQALAGQDHLYTLVSRDGGGSTPQVVGSIVGFALATGDDAAFARHVADPAVTILSLTITEGGYATDRPNPTIEAIADGLDARRVAGAGPITILSCDNLPGNGGVARAAIEWAAADRPDLRRYLEGACTFPNSMVDRITPQTTDADRAWLRDEAGIDDAWPVVAEPFRQWVVEDDFAAGRPRFEDAGVLFATDVHAWELYKLRMLNATHSCMAYVSALAGIVFVDEAMAAPGIRPFLERFLEAEAIPTLREIPGHPAHDYAWTVLARCENTGVRDQIARLCIDGTAKVPTFLIPTVEREVALGGPVACGALALAAWARYLGTTTAETRAPDSQGARSAELAAKALDDPAAFLELDDVFGEALRGSERFRDAFTTAYRRIAAEGSLAAIAALLNG